MTPLLDTHVLLWWLDDPSRLSKAAGAAIGDGRNILLIPLFGETSDTRRVTPRPGGSEATPGDTACR